MMATDVKIRGDRFSPLLREKKKLIQLPKDVRSKLMSDELDTSEKRSSKTYRKDS